MSERGSVGGQPDRTGSGREWSIERMGTDRHILAGTKVKSDSVPGPYPHYQDIILRGDPETQTVPNGWTAHDYLLFQGYEMVEGEPGRYTAGRGFTIRRVTEAYRAFLFRAPDAEGLDWWVSQIEEHGWSSSEFRGRFRVAAQAELGAR